jgi:acyl-CoA thioester hydrolase
MAEFEYRVRVRFCEVDEYGFAWHGHYLAWFEAARIEMLREAGLTPAELLRMGYLVPVLDLSIACKSPVRSDEEVTIFCSIEPAEKALLIFQYRIIEKESGRLCATGRTSHVVLNRREAMLYLLPDEILGPLRQLIEKYGWDGRGAGC